MENCKVKIDKDKGHVSVYLSLPLWKPGSPKVRYYESWARQQVEDKFPNIKLGKTIIPCVMKSQGPVTEGTWVFELIQKAQVKKISTKKKTKIKEKVNVETLETDQRTVTDKDETI